MKEIIKQEILFEVIDVFGKKVRTSKSYWDKIFLLKHKEVKTTQIEVKTSVNNPDEVRRSLQDPFISLFYKKIKKHFLVVVVKYLNNHGFIVTVYQTSKLKKKGKILWPK